jgi:IS605 OrfB family transposase
MKHAGTIKLEILGPDGAAWSEVKPRMFALRSTVAQALTLTMQDHHGQALAELRKLWDGIAPSKADKAWRGKAEQTLRANWNKVLGQHAEFLEGKEGTERACAQVTEYLTAETIDNILARFSGAHFKELIAGRDSLPSFRRGIAFYARSRACSIGGDPDKARLVFPLWGAGKHATSFVVVPNGNSDRAIWRKLVSDYAQRDRVVLLEKALKEATGAKKKAAERTLEKSGLTKMGRVGIVYNERRRKWFATISYMRYQPDASESGQRAAVNFGVNVFMQALAEDGTEWHVDGDQIIATRIRFAQERRQVARSIPFMGTGSKGRGQNRRNLPLIKRRGNESNFVTTYIRQLSASLISWCRRHGVADLHIEDLTDVREQFERQTEGQAHEEVKRRIHAWPFYETALAIKREGDQRGVAVHLKSARYVSQHCPNCGHTDPQNVQEIQVPTIPIMLTQVGPNKWVSGRSDGVLYRRTEKTTRFECAECHYRGKSDMIACANHLLEVGAKNPMGKMQEKARKRLSSDTRKKVRRAT